jgi:PAS fold.
VLFDNIEDAAKMENHSEREEFKSAMENGSGESSRYSDTLAEETTYYAKKLENGNVLRVSINHKSIFFLTLGMIRPFIIIVLAALLISLLLANSLSQKIIAPINNLDLEHPLECKSYDEFSPLLTHIAHLYKQIDNQKNELQNKKNEFYAIIENMNEGLIVLNNDEMILSINPSACKFFGDDNCIGKNFWQIERNTLFETNIKKGINDGNSKFDINRNGREYQLNISRIDA